MHLKPISRELKRELYTRLNNRRKHRSDIGLLQLSFQLNYN